MRALVFAVLALALSSAAFAQQGLTLKERLSDKASDGQRVDNCHVPPAQRGPVARPGCPAEPSAAASIGKTATAPVHR